MKVHCFNCQKVIALSPHNFNRFVIHCFECGDEE